GNVNVPVMFVVILLALTRPPFTSQSLEPLPVICILIVRSPPPPGPAVVESTPAVPTCSRAAISPPAGPDTPVRVLLSSPLSCGGSPGIGSGIGSAIANGADTVSPTASSWRAIRPSACLSMSLIIAAGIGKSGGDDTSVTSPFASTIIDSVLPLILLAASAASGGAG